MKYAYYASTALLALAMAAGGVFDTLSPPEVVEQIQGLGFPGWFPRGLGIWKLLGVVAVVAPGLPRLKEWAYAGFFFNLFSSVGSHASQCVQP